MLPIAIADKSAGISTTVAAAIHEAFGLVHEPGTGEYRADNSRRRGAATDAFRRQG